MLFIEIDTEETVQGIGVFLIFGCTSANVTICLEFDFAIRFEDWDPRDLE